MSIEIRIAKFTDAEAVCAAVRRSITECCNVDHQGQPELIADWLKNKTTENIVMWINEPSAIALVGLVDQEVVGFALCRNGELALCYVVPEVLHGGVGKSLLHAVESTAAKQGVKTLRLDSTQTAQDFYLRNGYIATGSAVYWAGLKCQPMSKHLEQNPIHAHRT